MEKNIRLYRRHIAWEDRRKRNTGGIHVIGKEEGVKLLGKEVK